MPRLLLLCILFVLQPMVAALAQSVPTEAGKPFFITRYAPDDYDLHAQNWDVVQDERGIMFMANWAGVLEHDGTEWRTHSIPNHFTRSLAVIDNGRVCIGGVGEIGCLVPDSLGSLRYQSLTDRLDEAFRDFGDVWTTHAVPGRVYFQSSRRILEWDGERIVPWEATERFHKAFSAHGRYFARDEGVGLVEFHPTGPELVPNGARFAEERIDVLLPVGEDDLLIVTRESGIEIWTDAGIHRVGGELERQLVSLRVYEGTMIDEHRFALATTTGTVVIGDIHGAVHSVLAENIGLEPHEIVTAVVVDHLGALWLTLDSGIMRVDAPTPLTVFDRSRGLEGVIYDVNRYEGRVHVATTQGLYRLTEDPYAPRFERVMQSSGQFWQMFHFVGPMLVATSDGVFEMIDDELHPVLDEQAFVLVRSNTRHDQIYAGLKDGIGVLGLTPSGWQLQNVIARGRVADVRSILKRDDGSMWVGTLADGVVRITPGPDGSWDTGRMEVAVGLPSGLAGLISGLSNGLHVMARDGVYTQSDRYPLEFERDEVLDAFVNFDSDGGYVVTATDEQVWVVNEDRISVLEIQGGRFVDVTPPVLQFDEAPVHQVYHDLNGVAWFSVVGEQRLVRFDPNVEKDYTVPYPAFVRSAVGNEGNLLFGGSDATWLSAPEMLYRNNNIRFTAGAAAFNRPEANQFQYWLQGFDDGWLEWTRDSNKEYTNLPEGRYSFHVRARNVHGQISETATFTFVVLPPWYRTWWAYASYVLLGVLVLWGYGRWLVRKHQQKIERERQVRETLELSNQRLRQANERLHKADRLKDDLLANTSHELRTPLTAILGFATVLKTELDGELGEFASHIERSGQRLQATVNALLDMARLQADSLDFERESFDVMTIVQEVVAANQHLADAKGLYLACRPETFKASLTSDRKAVYRVLENLVSNAIKFTNDGGVSILVDTTETEVCFTVKDTGIGIRAEFLPEIFGEFQQVSTGYARTFEGSGLGLSIAHRLAKLLGGRITVNSTEGEGSAFTVSLPRGDDPEVAPALRPTYRSRHVRTLCVGIDKPPGEEVMTAAGMISSKLVLAVGLAEALEKADKKIDLLIIDAAASPAGAAEILEGLRTHANLAETAFILVNSIGMPGEREHWLSAGFDDYVTRPISVERMAVVIEAVLQKDVAA